MKPIQNIFYLLSLFLINCHVLVVDMENKRYYPQTNHEVSQKYGTMIWGKFEVSKPREVSCNNGIRSIVIQRSVIDFIIHYFIGGIYSTRSIEADCYLDDQADIGRSLALDKKLILNSINFNLNSADILSESYPVLNKVAIVLKKENFSKLVIFGHTDLTGNHDQNLILSQRRADSVKKFLVDNGVSLNKISTKGLGSSKPLVNSSDEEANRKNRRIEFVLE